MKRSILTSAFALAAISLSYAGVASATTTVAKAVRDGGGLGSACRSGYMVSTGRLNPDGSDELVCSSQSRSSVDSK
jgi:hypothetical protein